jgi:HSP20 family protein
MWYPFSDFDRAFNSFSDLLTRVERPERPQRMSANTFEVATTLFETADGYEFRIDVPGASEEDLRLDVHDQTLTLSARRVVKPREGWSAHRAERQSFEWKRSFSFPEKIDPERVAARFDQGVLNVKLAKAPQNAPRRVNIGIG